MSDSLFNKTSYDRWSSHYDTYPNSTITVDEANFPPIWRHLSTARVLEIGCGTGRHTQKLLKQGNQVTALELSTGMLALAREKATGASFIEADFMNYDFAGEKFDAVICSLVLEHIEALEEFFVRVARVLRVGGEFFLSEIHPQRIASGSQAHFLDPVTGEDMRLRSHAHSEREISTAAEKAGLKIVTESDVLGTEALAHVQPDWIKYVGRPMIKIWGFQKI